MNLFEILIFAAGALCIIAGFYVEAPFYPPGEGYAKEASANKKQMALLAIGSLALIIGLLEIATK